MSWLQVLCSDVYIRRRDENMTATERRKHGWDYYPKNATPLYYAASFGLSYVVRALLEQGAEVDAMGGRLGATAFHAAALRGHVKVMDILFQKGADVNKMDFIMKTPLDSAALVGNVEVIEYLLEHGADPKIRDDQGKTAHDWALISGHVEAGKVLKAVTICEETKVRIHTRRI
jgi:ankyrin repeat protein